jgi:hypothetical protein
MTCPSGPEAAWFVCIALSPYSSVLVFVLVFSISNPSAPSAVSAVNIVFPLCARPNTYPLTTWATPVAVLWAWAWAYNAKLNAITDQPIARRERHNI